MDSVGADEIGPGGVAAAALDDSGGRARLSLRGPHRQSTLSLSLSLSLTHTVVLACLVFFWNAFQIDQHCPFGPIAVPFGATSLIN